MHRRTFLLTSLLPALLASTADGCGDRPKTDLRFAARPASNSRHGRGCRPQRRNGQASMEMSTSRPLPCLEEVEPRLVQRAAQLCPPIVSKWSCRDMVGQQWRRLHTGYGGAGAAGRYVKREPRGTFHYDGVPHGIKGARRDRHLRHWPGRHPGSPIRICQRGGRFEAPRPCQLKTT